MNRILFLVAVMLGGAVTLHAATTPVYVNASPVVAPPAVAPQIDASVFVNQSIFNIDSLSLNPLPYQTLNTKVFTNRPSGVMIGRPGYRFDFFTNNVRGFMDTWVNNGSISVDSQPLIFVLNPVPQGNWLMVAATNIISTGPLNAGSLGLVRLEGQNIDLRRNGIRTGPPLTNDIFFGGGYIGLSNYFNDFGVTDIYWGEGTNNNLNNRGTPIRLDGGGTHSFNIPFPQSPSHQVVEGSTLSGFLFTNIVTVPSFFGFFAEYGAHVFTNQSGPNSFSVQVVFVPTNTFDTNFSTDVRFIPDFTDGGATVVASFNNVDFDLVAQVATTNSVYLIDDLAFETNVFLARNFASPTRRPSTYEVTRSRPFQLAFSSLPGNATFDASLLYRPSFFSNTVRILYAGYSAFITSQTVSPLVGGGALADPTNFPGRIEIIGDQVNLDQTRIRADSTLIIKAKNLTSNRVAQVDAPFVNLDLGSTQPVMVISNIAPKTVRRLSGTLSAYSATWRNFELVNGATNTTDYHVLIVEPNFASLQPVVINELALHGNNLRIDDQLTVGKSLLLDAAGLHISGSGGISFPLPTGLASTNVQRVLNFTNDGVVSIPGAANYGADRALPYNNFINRGTNIAAAQVIRALNFENTGALVASGGLISIDAVNARFSGPPVALITNVFTNIFFDFFSQLLLTNYFTNVVVIGGKLESDSDIEINASDVVISNALFSAGATAQGSLILNVTNRLVDAGPTATNNWSVTAGFNTLRRPVLSDLLGTRVISRAGRFIETFHTWAGENRGAVPDGFTNNLALGSLVLDGDNFSLFHFRGTDGNNGLYVDYIEFQNQATNFEDSAFIDIDPSLTIYFANANVPAEKLDRAANERFRWVPDFAGPSSSTNIMYPSGQIYTFNIALVASKDLDSDGDGIVNADDPTPVFVAESIEMAAAVIDATASTVSISWNALSFSTSYVEYKDSFDGSDWQLLDTVVQGESTRRVNVTDQIGQELRVYRVRIEPGL